MSSVTKNLKDLVPIKVLICSANVGNAEPTEESLNAWIPQDGNLAEVVGNKKDKGFFSLIVIGMQEASFECESVSSSASSSSSSDDEGEVGKKSRRASLKEAGKDAAENVKDTIIKSKDSIESALTSVSKQVRSMTGSQDHVKGSKLLRVLTMGEGNDITAAEFYGGDTKRLYRMIQARCPSYKFVINYLRGQMRLIILVRNDHAEEISQVECKAENTGLGQILANKGGILATLTMRGTRLCFMSAHLAAHEGEEYYKARNTSLVQILSEAKVGPKPQILDSTFYGHHSFVCGDLNYRVKLPGIQNEDPLKTDNEDEDTEQEDEESKKELKKKQHELHVKRVLELIEKKDWKTLNDGDELSIGLKKKECLAGFQTPYCNFSPTFKLLREPGFKYNVQRTPSYTDRILWKSLDGLGKNLKNLTYHPCPGYITSDHKPIRGAFEIMPINMRSLTEQNSKDPTGQSFTIFVSEIKCRELVMSKSGDPYVSFMSNPPELLVKKEIKGSSVQEKPVTKGSWPKTKTIKSNLNPDWGDSEVQLALASTYDKPSKLTGAFLYVSVYDDDHGSDDLVGTVEVNLMDLVGSDNTDKTKTKVFQIKDRPITKYGRVRGVLSCKITGMWSDRNILLETSKSAVSNNEKERKKEQEVKGNNNKTNVVSSDKSKERSGTTSHSNEKTMSATDSKAENVAKDINQVNSGKEGGNNKGTKKGKKKCVVM